MPVTWPTTLSESRINYVCHIVKDWAISHGLAVRPSVSLLSEQTSITGDLAIAAPVTLSPSPFPSACFDQALTLQKAFNYLYAAIASDEKWLSDAIKDLIEVDDFIRELWNLHLACCQEGYAQSVSLGIFRSDYMLHATTDDDDEAPQLRQVEFNTIASSFGGLAEKVSCLHKYLLCIDAYPRDDADFPAPFMLPETQSIRKLASGLLHAHQAYKALTTPESACCILFVVQANESNVFDQFAILSELQESGTPAFRISLAQVIATTSINGTKRRLIFHPPYQTNLSYEVTVVYFRSGYAPSEYSDPHAWSTRLHLERSAAIKCPSILTHLAGSKKIQQILATPGSTHIEDFLQGTEFEHEIPAIRDTFAAIYPLDGTEAGKKAVGICRNVKQSENYVLKPQREGGGNNIYGAKIPPFLSSLGPDEKLYQSYILMEMIRPPNVQNTIYRNGSIQSGEVINELGIYGICLWDSQDGRLKTDSMLHNYDASFLLRTKFRSSEEGGVAAGFGCIDSPCLIDKTE